MKPKNNMVTVKSEPEIGFTKHNLKMAISRNVNQKRALAPDMEVLPRGTVLVNNIPAGQRTVISNGRAVNNRTVMTNARNINLTNSELLRCKRKINFLPGQSYPGTQPASVARRNARERNRVKQVNNGFATLRSHIPPAVAAALSTEKPSTRNSAASKKLSKVETLKMAVEYIRSLQDMLDDHNSSLEKKVADQTDGYDARYEVDDSYYSSSPDSSSQTVVSAGDAVHQYGSPERVFPKSEPIDAEYYPTRRVYAKSEPGEVFVKSEVYRPKLANFNQEIHEALTSEFYHARSPVKPFYGSPERSPVEHYKTFEEKNYEQLGDIAVLPGRGSPKGHITVLSLVPGAQYGPAFLQPRSQPRSSTSLSPSPTPSFSSDHSGHPSSVVSGSSGHLATRLSRLSTTGYPPLSSPVLRPSSPPLTSLTPPRNPSPASVISSSVVGSSSPTYSNGLEFQKGSPEYENYEPMSPEDEELLDAISWWQQSH